MGLLEIFIILFAIAFVISQFGTAIGLLYWVYAGLNWLYVKVMNLIRRK